MKREIINYLLKWKVSRRRKPLIMTGVRQCGKTYIQRKFGKQIMNKYIGKLLLKYYNICEICTIKI